MKKVTDRAPGTPKGWAFLPGQEVSDAPSPNGHGRSPIIKSYPLTEFGNTERLFDRHGQNIRYSDSHGFIAWTGKRWERESESTVKRWCAETIRSIYADARNLATQAARCEDEEGRKRLAQEAESLLSWARRSESDHMVRAMCSLIQAFEGVTLSKGEYDATFDKNHWLLNCPNGTRDLRTGKFYLHRKEDYITTLCPTEYHPEQKAVIFPRFFTIAMKGRPGLIDYVQRYLGYCLTGETSDQSWMLWTGEGENGKGTLQETLAYVLGEDYCQTLEPESLLASGSPASGSAPTPDIASLKGARLVSISETERGAKMATARMKKLTGQDRLKARFLNRDFFTFEPTHKFILDTNHRPNVRENTHAFWRRVRVVPFDHIATSEDKRTLPNLREQLRTEAQGILTWLVEGCVKWQKEGLEPPSEVETATKKYREEQDIITIFMAEECKMGDTYQVEAKALYTRYKEWSEQTMGERAMSMRSFKAEMEHHNIKWQHSKRANVWYGLALLEVGEEPEPEPKAPETAPPPDELPASRPEIHASQTPQSPERQSSTPPEIKELVLALQARRAQKPAALNDIFVLHPDGKGKHYSPSKYFEMLYQAYHSSDLDTVQWAQREVQNKLNSWRSS
jgi:putative DNA primase/helicase